MLIHAELYVRAITRSLTFYIAGLGMQLARGERIDTALPIGGSRRIQLRSGPVGLRVLLLELGEAAAQRPSHRGTLTLLVDNLAAPVARLRAAGFAPDSQIFQIAMPRVGTSAVVFYRDPDGHAIELLAPGAGAG